METKLIRNLILKSTLIELIFVIQCSSFERKESLIFRNINFVIYQSEDLKNSHKHIVPRKLLTEIFLSFQKQKTFLVQNEPIFLPDRIKEISFELSTRLKANLKYFIIIKEDDSLSPYTRFQKHSFEISFRDDRMLFQFYELNNFYNLGSKIEFQDWAIPNMDTAKCIEIPKFFFQKPGIEYAKNSKCKSEIDYSLIQVDLSKFGKILPTPSIKKSSELRLEELLNLYKKGYISKDDYELKKAEVLGEL